MPKRFYKHKLLLDENMPGRRLLRRLNERYDVKHVRDDLHRGASQDRDVYQLAMAQHRIVVTFNGGDFCSLVRAAGGPGAIDIPAGWDASAIDAQLTALLMRHGPAYFAGHYRALAVE